MDNKVVSINESKQSKQKKERKMLLLVILVGIISGLTVWNYFVANVSHADVQIPESKNITYNSERAQGITVAQVANEFEKNDGKPILLYLYATWCAVCNRNFENFNEITREFQNTDLHVIAISVDRDMDEGKLHDELSKHGNFYFHPKFFVMKDGFLEFLKQKKIEYKGRIPFTALISKDGEVIAQYSGAKRLSYIRNKIIEELYP